MNGAAAWSSFYSMLILIPPFLVAVSIHEFSHAAAATYFGDPTPKRMGRLTLNPLSHIDPFGLMFLLVFRFGWAKPVIFDERYFRHPNRDRIITALAGPASNLLCAWVSLVCAAYLSWGSYATMSFQLLAWINVMLGVFNLMPVPPLDGGHLVEVFLGKIAPDAVLWLRRYSIFIVLFLLYMPATRMLLVQAIEMVKSGLVMLVP